MNGIDDYNAEGVDFEQDMKFFDNTIKKTTKKLVRAVPSIITAVMLFTVFCMSWLKISVFDLLSVEFALSMLILVTFDGIIYFSCAENGSRSGREDGEYIKSSSAHKAVVDSLRAEKKLVRLGDYCKYYTRAELETAREKLMLNAGVAYEEYREKYLPLGREIVFAATKKTLSKALAAGKVSEGNEPVMREFLKLGPGKRKTVIRANLMRPIVLTPELLLANQKEHIGRNPISASPEKSMKKRDRMNLFPLVLCAFVAFSFQDAITTEFTLAALIAGIVQVVGGMFIAFKGYTAHYLVYSVDAVAFHESQLNVISGFEQWLEQEKCIK